MANLPVSPSVPKFKPVLKSKYLLVFALLLLCVLAGLFFLGKELKLFEKRVSARPDLNLEQINYPSTVWKERINKNFDLASKETKKNDQLELYLSIFDDLVGIYTNDHQSSSREQAKSLKDFIEREFSDSDKVRVLEVPCLDRSCGSSEVPDAITDVYGFVKDGPPLDPVVADNLAKKFEAASVSTNEEYKWGEYLAIFNSLKSESARTGNSDIKKAGEEMINFMRAEYSQRFTTHEALFPETFKL